MKRTRESPEEIRKALREEALMRQKLIEAAWCIDQAYYYRPDLHRAPEGVQKIERMALALMGFVSEDLLQKQGPHPWAQEYLARGFPDTQSRRP